MDHLDRIERSVFHRGEYRTYVGYGADGHVWRIVRRPGGGGWRAMCRDFPERNYLFAPTLAAMNAKLAAA